MKDFKVDRPPSMAAGAFVGASLNFEKTLTNHRIGELERRVGRIEAFLLGGLSTIALSVLGGLVALLNLPS